MTISKKHLDEIRAIKDEDIDYSDIPELDDEWFKNARVVIPNAKSVSVKLDKDVVKWYQAHDKNYQAKINAILRAYMNKQKAHAKA